MSRAKRVRVVQYLVQPVLVVDDGVELSPLQVEPITIPAAGWTVFVERGLNDALAKLEAELNEPEAHEV